jgi:hypothetical protein
MNRSKVHALLAQAIGYQEVPRNYYVWAADLTIFFIFPYSWSH